MHLKRIIQTLNCLEVGILKLIVFLQTYIIKIAACLIPSFFVHLICLSFNFLGGGGLTVESQFKFIFLHFEQIPYWDVAPTKLSLFCHTNTDQLNSSFSKCPLLLSVKFFSISWTLKGLINVGKGQRSVVQYFPFLYLLPPTLTSFHYIYLFLHMHPSLSVQSFCLSHLISFLDHLLQCSTHCKRKKWG